MFGFIKRFFQHNPNNIEECGLENSWKIEKLKEATSFFEHLHILNLSNFTLILIDGAVSDDMITFFNSNEHTDVTAGDEGRFYGSIIFKVKINSDSLKTLIDLFDNHAPMEIVEHIFIEKDDKRVLEWYDAFDNTLEIDKETVNEQIIKDFCEKTGSIYQ